MIENIEYRGLEGAKPVRPLTDYEVDQHIRLTMGEEASKGVPCPKDLERSFSEPGSFTNMIIQRLNDVCWAATGEQGKWETIVTPAALLMVSILKEADLPANATLWAYTFVLLRAKHGEQVNLDILSMDEFPEGYPDIEAYRNAWEAQKKQGAPRSNFLDSREAWIELLALIFQGKEAGDAVVR